MNDSDYLPYGPLTNRTAHLCVDMQQVFAADTPWHTPWMARVMPQVLAIAQARPAQTIFTRFIPPKNPERASGTWRRYYEVWRDMTGERIDPRLLDLVPPLPKLVPPALVIDKPGYSALGAPSVLDILRERGIDSLVITGLETDVCVLATVLAAIDLGFRVVLATDALCGSSDQTHDGLMRLYRERFSSQVETATAEIVLSCWL
jgi:nicotinamidase-related amidase